MLINVLDMRSAHIDADCVLFGDITQAGTTIRSLLGWRVPRTLFTLTPMLGLVLLFVVLLWKELKLVAFDPALAAAMGFRVAIVHYLLMGMVAGVSVASFEAVGSILVVAMLIVPAAAAAQLTDRLKWMLAWAVAIGAVERDFWLSGRGRHQHQRRRHDGRRGRRAVRAGRAAVAEARAGHALAAEPVAGGADRRGGCDWAAVSRRGEGGQETGDRRTADRSQEGWFDGWRICV